MIHSPYIQFFDQITNLIIRYGKWENIVGENISYGMKSGIDVVMQLVVDDGVSNRGHRLNIFNPNYFVCGIGASAHSQQ